MGYRPAVAQAELGPELVKEYNDQAQHRAARRATGDPHHDRTQRHRGAPRQARGHARARVLAQPRSGRRNPRVQGIPAPRVPAERLRVARSGRPPRLPEADGRVAGAGRRQRLHAAAGRGDRSVRAPAGRARSRQAALLRDRDAVGRRRASGCSSRATRAGRRRSKATRIIRRAAARPTSSPRRRSSVSTIPIARRRSRNLGEIRSVRARSSPAMQAVLSAQASQQGCRHPDPDRDRRVADARRADAASSSTRFPQAKWMQWEPCRPPQRARGQPARLRRIRRRAVRHREGRRHPLARRRLPLHRRRRAATRARVRVAPPRSKATGRSSTGSTPSKATPTNTGAQGRSSPAAQARREIEAFARAVARALGVAGVGRRAVAGGGAALDRRRSSRICRPAQGRSLVIAGDGQPPVVHALAHAMNEALGNVGATVVYTQTAEVAPIESARRAAGARRRDERRHGQLLLISRRAIRSTRRRSILKFADAMQKVALRVHLGLYETRRRRCATGTSPKRTTSRRGATCAPTTARSRSSSR